MTDPAKPDRRTGDDEESSAEGHRSPPERDGDGDPFADLNVDQAAVDAVRKAVGDRVSGAFRDSVNEHDIEDVVQTAWEGVLRQHRKEPVTNLRALSAEIAGRATIKLTRLPRAVPCDPLDSPVLDRVDQGLSPVELLEDRAQMARLAEALEQLDEDKLAAFHLRFIEGLPHDAACERLGIARSAYFERVKAAKAAIEGAVALTSHRFNRRQRQLLSDLDR